MTPHGLAAHAAASNATRTRDWIAGSAIFALAAATFTGCASSTSRSAPSGDSTTTGARHVDEDVRIMIAEARESVFPALVNVEVVSLDYQGGKEEKHRSTGSGTILSKDGYVLTNAHVTQDGAKFWCVLSDKQRIPATLVGEDPWTDLAVLKLDIDRLRLTNGALPTATLGDSRTLKVGDYVMAMGSPFALSRTVTLGVVSNTERVFTSMRDAGEVDEMYLGWGEQRTGLFTNWIQHDALINPGNSGGPLVNLRGEVVGVNTRGGAGMAFATPSNMAKSVFEALVAAGEVERSSVGATFRHLQNTGLDAGVLIDSVETDGPAAAAGLQAGDVVLSLNGEAVNVRFAEEVPPLLKRIADLPVGSAMRLAYERDGAKRDAVVQTRKLLRDKGDEAALRTWGVTAQKITPRMAQVRRLGSTRGALVTSVRGGSAAATAEPAIGWGDRILGVDGHAVNSLDDLVVEYNRIDSNKDKPEWVLVEFERESKNLLTLIKPKPEERPDPPPELPKAWIGIATQPVIRNMAEKLGHADQRGFRVIRVYSGTEAARAGLNIGDLIVGMNGEKMSPRGLQDAGVLSRAVRALSIDSDATLSVFRDGRLVEIPLKLERTRITQEETPRARNRDFELAVRDITFFDREDRRWGDEVSGVIVDQVEQAGWAGLAGVGGGDVIQRIGDRPVTDLATYKDAMAEIARIQPERVVFVIFRGSRTYFRFVEPEWKARTSGASTSAE